jgi:hypothetical protein
MTDKTWTRIGTWIYSFRLQTKTNSIAFSPHANYTDWATATGRRILVQTSDGGVSRGQRGGSRTVVNLSFRFDYNHDKLQSIEVVSSTGFS